MYLDLDGRGAAYEQLARALKRAILDGRMVAGHQLPATRELSDELGLSHNTVLTAYELLCAEGLVRARRGSGTYVNDVASRAPAGRSAATVKPQSRYSARLRKLGPLQIGRKEPGVRFDLQYGEPMVNLPLVNRWRSELAGAAVRASIHYPQSQGVRALREAISDYLARRRGVAADPDDIVVVGGTQQALSLLARVLVDKGDTVAIEEPHYQMAVHALRAHGARIVNVRTDEQGLVTQALPRRSPGFIFTTSSHQFPSACQAARGPGLQRHRPDSDGDLHGERAFRDPSTQGHHRAPQAPRLPARRTRAACRRRCAGGRLARWHACGGLAARARLRAARAPHRARRQPRFGPAPDSPVLPHTTT